MALKTLGTNANNSMSAFVVGTNDLIPADVATVLNSIKTPQAFTNFALVTGPRNLVNGSYTQQGTLLIPGRGVLICQPGDWIGIDANTGWPVLLSADVAANGLWTHN